MIFVFGVKYWFNHSKFVKEFSVIVVLLKKLTLFNKKETKKKDILEIKVGFPRKGVWKENCKGAHS